MRLVDHYGETLRWVEELSVPLARMPVFARAGSVLVRQPYRYNEAEGAPKRLLLDVLLLTVVSATYLLAQ